MQQEATCSVVPYSERVNCGGTFGQFVNKTVCEKELLCCFEVVCGQGPVPSCYYPASKEK